MRLPGHIPRARTLGQPPCLPYEHPGVMDDADVDSLARWAYIQIIECGAQAGTCPQAGTGDPRNQFDILDPGGRVMHPIILLLVKTLVASLIVGFVTASIQSWVDRFFLVILLAGLVGLPIQSAIAVNLVVVALAALTMALRQGAVLRSVKEDWALLIVPAVIGGMLGRLLSLQVPQSVLLVTLGGYAILAGVRMALVRPGPERTDQPQPAWQALIAFFFGSLTGLLSAGGKPFSVPLYNRILGHHPKRAYALASVGVTAAAFAAVGTQIAVGVPFASGNLALAVYAFVLITVTALGVQRIWSQRLSQIVTWVISPLLVLAGIRFLMVALG